MVVSDMEEDAAYTCCVAEYIDPLEPRDARLSCVVLVR